MNELYDACDFLYKFILVAAGSWVPRISPSSSRLWVYLGASNESSQSSPKLLFVQKKKGYMMHVIYNTLAYLP